MDCVGIDETFGFIPQGIQLLSAVSLDFHYLWRPVHAGSVQENGNHQLAHGVAVRRQHGLLPCLQGVKEKKGIAGVEFLAHQANQISDYFAGGLVVNPLYGLVAGIGDFLGIFRQLDFGNKLACGLVQDSSQFVYSAKDGQSLAVIRLVPTPQELMAAPCIFRELIRFSSRSLEAEITASGKPASVSIFLAFWTGRPNRRCPAGFRRR